jgi:3-phosphoshikimate 1-carboxyvinyltransferase
MLPPRTPDAPCGLDPGQRVAGTFRPPGSKSIAQRALVAAALCGGRTVIGGLPRGDDVRAARKVVEALGATYVHRGLGECEVVGVPPARALRGPGARNLFAGESGTLARLATAALALRGAGSPDGRVVGRGTLLRRRSIAFFSCLYHAGAVFAHDGVPGSWPVDVRPADPPPDLVLELPRSSQEVSALLVALAAWPGVFRIEVQGPIPSRPYVDLTLDVLARFGVEVCVEGPREHEELWLCGPLRRPAGTLEVEADASTAAVALAAACLSDGEIAVEGIDARTSRQADVQVLEVLRAFGCEARGEGGVLAARGRPSRGAELDLSASPDVAPVAAALAAGAALAGGGQSRLSGLATLRDKESDRVIVLAAGLRAAGLAVEEEEEALVIGAPDGALDAPVVLDPAGDHRMAFAFALLSLVRRDVRVSDPGCVAKSWPGFWDDLAGLSC